MLNRLLDTGSTAAGLKAELNRSTRSVREIAHRVSNASSGRGGDFSSALEEAREGEKVDLEREMVALAEEQLRFDAATRLLQKVYQQMRSSLREG